ncbi:aminotransferase class I/II-fold pyridoxal phosphate-dependent enzyme [Corynebacterium sp. 153RC1]|uniref:aminotransferase class I/II-fold pyridoxal phosphate-dependent enzyme n=1 Tax=unclassified Corynebacterium TaxID=2624378 RepID=UPI00211BB564|nr:MULTISPECIES: aminotransferase class I/II-fold pyridoxal phosphate-dependent enzyme [unclassified Corynebacterium]MCQ9352896.1 aminotransferase class I/II-fold pyridoxal phosphate-dependent enzyme [Corynebacterium sp. 209RC1]MCQ9355102.1 aminotransferase class I/II-fold pyridoxal phosphate-dependent enzyme [Corynebacterium sp. 1222RC1]MCQ9357464.1 aminotransferase class I/II-fold pyridoxal phosphate-dependent enzyme [Corynebacterium sp. 122RC1]MCQ9359843.1 aminotransferase class I/II-fold py
MAVADLNLDDLRAEYEQLKAKNLKLDLTRGKPSSEQLDFSNALLSLPGENFKAKDGTDCRNYGGLVGIPDIREMWAQALGLPAENVIAGDASSLNIMFDMISWAYIFGTNDSQQPWSKEETVKWICPVPGYDRHFTITEHFGFEMITVPLNDEGPDLDAVRELVKDPQVKGMWCVPVFGNPTGITFSEATCRALAEMETAAPDFRIVWDNAYALHTLTDEFPINHNVLEFAAQAGNPNRFWFMSSTSKITHAGAGVSFLATSTDNLKWYESHASVRGIGPNKINQLAHAQFFGNVDGIKAVMQKHAGSLAPKFARVLEILEHRLGGKDVATWSNPTGGYFISVDVVDGTASRVVELAKEAGIALTGAGSSFPLKQDPRNRNIRLAPSLPPVEELEVAMDGFATCVLLAAAEKAQA